MREYRADRQARPFGRWGFTFPPTPTTGPLRLDGGAIKLVHAPMNRPYCDHQFPQGCWTDGIDNCVVIAVAQYTINRWRHLWFLHVQGGDYLPFAKRIAGESQALPKASLWGVVAGKSWAGLETMGESLISMAKIPTDNICLYQSGSDFAFGVRLSGGAFGGAFGEVTNDGFGVELPSA